MFPLLDLLYVCLSLLAIPYWLWGACRHGKYRQGWWAKLTGRVPMAQADGPVIWLHAVSLGEVNLLGTLIAELRRARPDLHCYITTTTRTGYEAAVKRYGSQHQVSYAPFDFSWAVKSALRRIRPTVLVLAELEIWPNLVRLSAARGVPVTVVNGRLSPRSFRGYQRIRWALRPTFARLHCVAVQSQEYAERFLSLGVDPQRVVVTGSLKFDGAEGNRNNSRTVELRRLAAFQAHDVVWLAGSTFPPEEQIVIDVFQQLRREFPHLRLVIVPRHPERFDEVAELLQRSGLPWSRRSRLPSTGVGEGVLLVDTIGELGAWWGTAALAFVGGSMGPRGGQNMIEPAAYGAAICFGPQTTNFRDVVRLMLQAQAAEVVVDADALRGFIRRGMTDESWRQELGQRAAQLVQRNQGATRRTVELLLPLLPQPAHAPAGCQPARLALIV